MVDIEQYSLAFLGDLKQMPHRKIVWVSGGKDSMLTLDLSRRVLGDDMDVVFVDVGAEFPGNSEFIHQAVKEFGLELIEIKPEDWGGVNFWQGLERFGVPSLKNLWCSGDMKLAAQRNYSKQYSKSIGILGVRAFESPRRLKNYPNYIKEVSPNHLLAFPALEWFDDEVWEYTHAHNLPINPCYELGHPANRCWSCPTLSSPDYLNWLEANHSDLYQKLATYPELEEALREKWKNYASKCPRCGWQPAWLKLKDRDGKVYQVWECQKCGEPVEPPKFKTKESGECLV